MKVSIPVLDAVSGEGLEVLEIDYSLYQEAEELAQERGQTVERFFELLFENAMQHARLAVA